MKKIIVFGLLMASMNIMAKELIVFKVTGDQFKPGEKILENDTVKLNEGESLKLITTSGKIIELSGPYNAPVSIRASQTEKGITDTLKVLMSGQQKNTKDMGVTRDSTSIISTASSIGWVPKPWVVNISVSGPKCIQAGNEVILWRADKNKTDLRVKLADQFEALRPLTANESFINAPADLPVIDGGKYKFEFDSYSTEATFNIIPDNIKYDTVIAAWMNEVGCTAQALSLLSEEL